MADRFHGLLLLMPSVEGEVRFGEPSLRADGIGHAVRLAGRGHLVLAHRADFEAAEGTMSALAMVDATDTKMILVSKDDGSRRPGLFALEAESGGRPRGYLFGADRRYREVVGAPGSIRPGVPFRLTLTWGPARLRLYLDGREVAADLAVTEGGAGNDAPVFLGRYGAREAAPLHGALQDVAFWSRQLTPTAVAALPAARADGDREKVNPHPAVVPIADRPRTLFYPGARFPNSGLAPIRTPYLFLVQLLQEERLDPPYGYWTGAYTVTVEGRPNLYERRAAELTKRGLLVLRHLPFAQSLIDARYPGQTQESLYGKSAAAGEAGVILDELLHNSAGTPPNRSDWLAGMEALLKIKAAKPEFFTGLWVATVDQTLPSGVIERHAGVDLFLPEAYVYQHPNWPKIDGYIDKLRGQGVLGKSLIALWLGHNRGGTSGWSYTTEAALRQQVARVRERAPECPGVAFWGQWSKENFLRSRDWVAKAIRDSYLTPSPTVRLSATGGTAGESAAVELRAEATPNATTRRAITGYRWFVDNVCVALTEEPRIYLAPLQAGERVLTVHAVDADHLAAAAQVRVEVR